MRVIIGLLKGLVVGGGIGYGMLHFGLLSPIFAYLACGLVGALVGVVAGRAPWKAETIWTPVLKLVVGAGIGVGLCALGLHFAPDTELYVKPLQLGFDKLPLRSGAIWAPIVGVLYGIFVEWDDGGGKSGPPAVTGDKPAAKKSA
ncbi:MAG TPA: hypothetical protein VHB97_26835 [Polyangia bacterium]|jgi:hypothetical protein|nr:hypothetical protein [Polyangia bacterium]